MDSNKKISPKDVFLHLLGIITLYISAVSFTTLIFQFVNTLIPDPLLEAQYYRPDFSGAIRWAIASLTVIFPVFVFVSRLLDKSYLEEPEKRNLKIRKWLLYFTLFAAALVIIGDLVALIYNFLNGDLTIKFLLKILAVLFVAGSVFGYYLWTIKNEKIAWRDEKMRFFVLAVIAVVALSTIYGFFVAGSPFKERLRKFDERRIQDLQSIQWQIVNYWQRKEKLPENLDMLRDDISGFVSPRDPETGAAYEYKKLNGLNFELCADFKTRSSETMPHNVRVAPPPEGTLDNWLHEAVKTCFKRTIDPELYPPFEKPRKG